jgi:hypothetical protein
MVAAGGLLRRPLFSGVPCMNVPKRVLFVCVENANRSQMAEAFARILGGDAVEARERLADVGGIAGHG